MGEISDMCQKCQKLILLRAMLKFYILDMKTVKMTNGLRLRKCVSSIAVLKLATWV